MFNQTRSNQAFVFLFAAIVISIFVALSVPSARAQATISSGTIAGTVTDPSGAAIAGAKITITNKDTGQVLNFESTSTGTFSSGGLTPGVYAVKIEAPGFKTEIVDITAKVGVAASANIKLEVGTSSTVIEVTGEAVTVNTEQPTVQGVLMAEQIENLPIDGRNFLALAQLEPGVQIQDGSNFDPTKVGYSSISFGDDSDARRASRWTELTSAMKLSAPQPRTYPPVASRNSKRNNPRWISLQS